MLNSSVQDRGNQFHSIEKVNDFLKWLSLHHGLKDRICIGIGTLRAAPVPIFSMQSITQVDMCLVRTEGDRNFGRIVGFSEAAMSDKHNSLMIPTKHNSGNSYYRATIYV